MKKSELESLLASNQQGATGALSGNLSHLRTTLADRYMGEPYGDEVDGRSKIVMTDVRDTIESIKPELMDIFFGGDRVVSFAPRGDDDVDAAEQETEVLNYIVQQQNNGFILFYNWFHDALVYKNGYIKRGWDERKTTKTEEYDGLSYDELAEMLLGLEQTGADYEVVEQWGDPEMGEPLGVKIKVTEERQRYVLESVPPEEVIVSPLWTRIDFDGCPFVAHRSIRPVSDFLRMGFDRKQIEALPTHPTFQDSEEVSQRFSGEDYETRAEPGRDGAMRDVLVYENYIMADYDGDGLAELLQVFTDYSGNVLRRDGTDAIEPVDGVPFNALCPIPIPHKHVGLSVAEIVQDLQRLRTVLSRQMIDNIVMSNNPDRIIDENSATQTTYGDLQVTQPGRNIRIPGGPASIRYEQPPQTAQQSLMGIEYVDGLRESRTGVTRYNQGLDADSLNKTATGIRKLMTAAQKKILLIARIFAETGVRQLFLDMHRDVRKGPMKQIAIRLRGEWVEVDPREWAERDDMVVSVGLGTGDRDLQFARLMEILAQQKEALQIGMVGPKNIRHTLSKMLELSGFKDVDAFFPDEEESPMQQGQDQPPQQDPTVMLAQVEAQKNEMAQQVKMAELEIKREELGLRRMELSIKQQAEETRRMEVAMRDERERDITAAKIEAEEAKRLGETVEAEMMLDG